MDRYTPLDFPLAGSRVLLRPPRPGIEDAQHFYQGVRESMAEILPWLGWVTPDYSLANAQDYVSAVLNNWESRVDRDIGLSLWIMDKEDRTFLGNLVMWNIRWYIPSFEFGFWTSTPHAGQGYMSESIQLLARYMFSVGAARVEIRCEDDNERMHRLMKRNGLALDGKLPNAARAVRDHRLTTVAVYSWTSLAQLPSENMSE